MHSAVTLHPSGGAASSGKMYTHGGRALNEDLNKLQFSQIIWKCCFWRRSFPHVCDPKGRLYFALTLFPCKYERCPSIKLLKCCTNWLCFCIFTYRVFRKTSGSNGCKCVCAQGQIWNTFPAAQTHTHTQRWHISVITEYIRKIRRLFMILGETGPAVCALSVLWSLHNHQSAFA